jgi:hypothetical protein
LVSTATEEQHDQSIEVPKTVSTRQAKSFWLALALIFAFGLMLRIQGSRGEMWLDEVWSLMLIAPLKSAAQIFTTIHHDNNHYLVSLWMFLWGPNRSWWLYRVPSILAGMGAVFTAIRIGLRRSQATALVAGLMFSLAYLAVFYSSEARGYAIACWMALVAFDALELYASERSWRAAAQYQFALVVGMLGNLSYVNALIASTAWAAALLLFRERTPRSRLQFLALHAPAFAILGALWLIDVRKMQTGSGPLLALWVVIRETLNYTLGLDAGSRWGNVLIIAALAFVIWQIGRFAHRRDLQWVFFATALMVAPAVVLFATGRGYPFPRHFLIQVYLFYLLLALAMGDGWERSGARARLLLGGALAAWVMANAHMSIELARIGRGHYKQALEYIAAHTSSPPARIGSLQDFRSEMLVGYYQRYLPPSSSPQLILEGSVERLRPEWLLSTISPYEWPSLPERIKMGPVLEYALVKEFPSVRLSGFPAGVYRRTDLLDQGGNLRTPAP